MNERHVSMDIPEEMDDKLVDWALRVGFIKDGQVDRASAILALVARVLGEGIVQKAHQVSPPVGYKADIPGMR